MHSKIFSAIIKFYVPSIVSFFLGLISAVVLTRVFTTEAYGLLTIFNNAVTLILSISYLGLDSAYVRFFNEVPDGLNRKELGYLLLGLTLKIFSFISLVIVLFFRLPFSKMLFGINSSIMCIALFLNVSAQIVIRYYLLTYRMQICHKMYSIITIGSQIAIRFSVLIAAIFAEDINVVIICNTMGIVLMTFGVIILRYNDLIPTSRIKVGKVFEYPGIIKYALYAAPIPIILSLNSFIAQRIIILNMDYGAVGVYSSANYFNTLFGVLQSGFATFWSAYVFKNYRKEHEFIKKMHDILFLLVIMVYGLMILARDLIYIIIGTQYHESKTFYALALFYPIMILLTETTGYGISIKKKNYISLGIHCISFVANIVLSLILIGVVGLKGIALASAISGVTYYVLSTCFAQRYYNTIISKKKSFVGLLIIFVMMICSNIANSFIQKGVELVLMIAALLVYHTEFRMLIKAITTEKNSYFKKNNNIEKL